MKKCKQGYYYCYKDKKCKKIPLGYRVGLGGWLRREKEEEKEEETKKNGNGNGANGNGNGNGESNGGSDGGGVSEAWSAKYKKSIDCNNPKGFSQRAHCRGRKKVNEEKKDHEYSMARSELKTIKNAASRLQKKMGKKGEGELKAWVQSKITKAADYIDTAADYVTNEETIAEKRDGKSAKSKGYSLRDWFKGGGWVQAGGKYDGKPCAKQPGQKTKPFCRDADDRASMSKDERERRAAKKRREDPNPDRKGKAKNVTEMASEKEINKKIQKKVNTKDLNPAEYIKNTNMMPGSGIQKKLANSYEPEGGIVDEGKKDACYHKVKSRYSVWPSAYASGALVKCRKVGAKNWGNKTKKEGYDYSNWRDDFQALEIETIDLIKADPIEVPRSTIDIIKEGAKKKGQVRVTNVGDTLKKSVDNQIMTDPELKLIKKKFIDLDKAHYEPEGEVLDEKCWKGYEKKGMKTMFGKRYPNCVKKKKTRKEEVEVSEGKYTRGEIYKKGTAPHRDPVAGESYPKEIYKKKVNVRLADEVELGEMKNGGDNDPCWDTHKQVGMKKKGGKMVPNCVPKNEEYSNWRDELEEGAAWTKKEGKNKSGGLNEKGRKSYERENPGSDLKRPSKKVGNKRRKSFCARMKGMKKKLTSKKTANDPDSRINKSLRAWNC